LRSSCRTRSARCERAFRRLREYAATHCAYDVPPSQIGWPAMIYVADTDERAREEFEPHFWTSP